MGELWSGLAIAHAITSSVRDSAALPDATSGAEIGDPYWAPPQKRPYHDEVGADPGRLRIAFTLRQRTRVTARQLEVRMLVIDEIHSILAGTFREQRIVLNAIRFLANDLPFLWFASGLAKLNKRS